MSRLQSVYEHSPIAVQNLMTTVYGLVLQHRRYGGGSAAYLRELLDHETWSREQVAAMQLGLLRERSILALTRVPAYRDLAGRLRVAEGASSAEEILDIFPVLTKEQVRRDPASFIPQGIGKRLIRGQTSGTTGTPLRLYRTLDGMRINFAFFARLRRWRGLTHWSRTSTLMSRPIVPAGQARPPYWRYAWLTKNQLLSSYHMTAETLPLYARALFEYQPEEIVAFPSSGVLVARAILESGLKLQGIRAVFTTAETLFPEDRVLLEAAFNCPVADQYGSAEWTVWISQCEQGAYHQHPEYGWLEILDSDGRRTDRGSGRAVATGFINEAMVLMRYDTGDRMTVDGTDCPCGRCFPTVAAIEGRDEDSIVMPDGRIVRRLIVALKQLAGIVECQIVQTDPDRIQVRVVPGSEWTDTARGKIVANIVERVGRSMRIDTVLVDSIPRTRTGKFRAVVSLERYRAGGAGDVKTLETDRSGRE